MNQERFHKGMEELKNKYESLQMISSSEKIFRAVQQDQQKRRTKRKIYWPPIAATIAFFLISTILITSIFSNNNEFSQSTHGNNNTNENVIGDVHPNEKENGELNEYADTENVQNNENDLPPAVLDRPEEKVIVEWPEGMAEEVTYELYVNENFRFSTYIAPHIQLSITEENNTLHFIAEYLQMEMEMLPQALGTTSFKEIELQIKSDLSKRGFSEYHDADEKMFQSLEYQGIMLNETEELISFYGILINNVTGAIYKYHAVMPIIAQEGTFYPAVKRFVDEMIFY